MSEEQSYPPDPNYPIGSTKILFNQQDQQYSFLCPHCNHVTAVEKNAVNCHIFRHGNFIVRRDSQNRPIAFGDSIPPHSPQAICDDLVAKGLIVGCGKPLQMYLDNNQYYVRICDYI